MSFQEEVEPDDYVKELTCQGCKHDMSNQLAHMEIGGCLYSEPDVFTDQN